MNAAAEDICRRFNPFVWMLAGAPESSRPIMLETFRQEMVRQIRLDGQSDDPEFHATCICKIISRRVYEIEARESGRA
ncbi:MAG: hypothetical protein U1E25_07410 [Methylocystis sp.]